MLTNLFYFKAFWFICSQRL